MSATRITLDALKWRPAGRPGDPDAWRVLERSPSSNTGFFEAGSYEFEKPATGWALHIDDEPLADSPENPNRWVWQPGFFAGEVTAELFRPGGSVAGLFLLDVSPDSSKIGRDVFAQMVSELWETDPSLVVGSEPATRRIGELGSMQDPWLAYARLRRYGADFVQALDRVRARPRRTLLVRRESSPLHLVRRVDRQTAHAALRSSAVASWLAGREPADSLAPDSRLDVPAVEETLDCAANRCLLALTRAVLLRCNSVASELQRRVETEPDSETRTTIASRWPARRRFLEGLCGQLRLRLRSEPFVLVRRHEISAAGLTAIAADPVYARAWGRGWCAIRHGTDGAPTDERLWISPTWEIYERWCFIKLAQRLVSSFPSMRWRRHAAARRWDGEGDGVRVELSLQPTFRANRPSAEGRWSVSKEREPDLVLTVEGRHGVRFVVLDAKYRASRANVLDAMASAHIYQDSLRIGDQRPQATLLLIPSGGGADWLEDPAFQSRHRVGAHVMSPDGSAAIPELVLESIRSLI